MAKAKVSNKSQRVFVKPVGTWAYVEAVVPKWVKGCEEPIKIAYDCGMGREFAQEELKRDRRAPVTPQWHGGTWRICAAKSLEERRAMRPSPLSRHPSDGRDHRARLGRLARPGAEYDLDPYRIERQAEIIVRAPIFMKLLEEFVSMPSRSPRI